MALITEMFDRGVVTSRDATLLSPGELQQAEDCVYRRNDPSLQSVGGRTEYNSSAMGSPSKVKGLAHLSFDTGKTDQLIAHVDGSLYGSTFSAITGTFAKITGPGVVTDAVTNGTTTVTSASNGFADMVKGAFLYGTGIPIGARVATVPSAGSITMTQAATGSATITLTALLGIALVLPNEGTETLDYIQWGSIYYAMIKGARPTRLHWVNRSSVDSTDLPPVFAGRPSGLDPVTDFGRGITAGDTSGPDIVAGSWDPNLGTGTYWFLVVEAINPGEPDEIEGSYMTGISPQDPKSTLRVPFASITNTSTQAIRVTFPAPQNTAALGKNHATHWIVYMSDKTTNSSTFPSLATFKRVAVTPISSTSITLGVAGTQFGPKFAANTGVGPNGQPEWASPSLMRVLGDGMASAISGFAGGTKNAEELLSNFGLDATTGTIRGVQIVVYCEAWTKFAFTTDTTGRGDFYVQIIAGTKRSPVFFGSVTGQYRQGIVFGGRTDAMGVSWVDTDFDNGTFTVLVGKSPTTEKQFMKIDGVEVAVFTGNEAITNGRPFPVVTYRSQVGTTVVDPAALPAPNATTGDVFQGQFVLNDPAEENVIRYSLPGFPEYFPKPYLMRLDSKKRDKVKLIRRVGQVLVVGLQSTMKRINYLPTEIDTDPRPGVAHEDLASDHGCVGPMAACLFDPDEEGVLLAYISTKGIHATDGISTRFLSTDLVWSDLVDVNNIGTCVLRNYSKENWLVLFYPPAGTSHGQNTRALVFSYAPEKMKDNGMLPAMGPFKVSARSAAEANLNGISYVLTGHETLGKVYVEDSGLTLPASYTVGDSAGSQAAITLVPTVKTRRFFPAGLDRQARNERIYIQHTACGATSTVASCPLVAGNTTVTNNGAFGAITAGMYATATGMKPGTIVISATANSIVLSQAPHTSGTVTITFSTGTIAVTIGGQDIGGAVTADETQYIPLHVGGLVVAHMNDMRQALEMTLTRVLLPNGSTAALSPRMKLGYFAYLDADAGRESNRAAY